MGAALICSRDSSDLASSNAASQALLFTGKKELMLAALACLAAAACCLMCACLQWLGTTNEDEDGQ
jgi:hypothetical protein